MDIQLSIQAGDDLKRQYSLSGDWVVSQMSEAQKIIINNGLRSSTALLDLSAVTEIDFAGLQTLISWQSTLRAGGGDLFLTATSPVVSQYLRLLGLDAASLGPEPVAGGAV